MFRRLILAHIFSSIAMLTFCQNENDFISIEFENISLPEAISKLNSETNYRFAYNISELKKDSITASFEKVELTVILSEILPSNHFFKINNQLVIIFRVDENRPSDETASAFNFTIQGEVLDIATLEPLPYAYIFIPSNKSSAESDLFGKFYIKNVPTDTSIIKVSYVGYEPKTFYLNPNMDKKNIQILMNATNIIKDANVSPEDVPISISRNSEINQLNYLNNKQLSNVGESDALSLLKYVGGFNAAADGEQTYSFQGLKPDENSFLLDGTNVLRPSHFFGQFSSINSLSIKNVRVLKGGYSAEHGGRAGALLEITSLDGNSKKPQAVLKTGLLGASARVNGSLFKDKGSFSIASRRSYSPILESRLYEPLLNSVINSNVFIAGDIEGLNVGKESTAADVKFSDSYGKFTFKPSRNFTFQVNGFYNDDLSSLSYTSSTEFQNSSSSTELITDLIVNENQTLQSGFYTEINELNHKTKIEYAFSDSLKLSGGVDFFIHEILNNESSFGIELTSKKSSQKNLSGFLESEFTLGKTRTRLGWRLTSYSAQMFNAPRIRLSSELGNDFFLNAGYGRHYQFMRKVIPLNLFIGSIDQWILSDNEIRPAENNYYTISGQKRIGSLTLNIELIKSSQKNAIESISSIYQGARANSVNLEDLYKGSYKNISLNTSIQYNWNNHSFSANYTAAKSKGIFNLNQEVLEFKNPRVSAQNLSLFWLWKNEKFNTSTSVIYSTGKPITPVIGSYVTEVPNGSFRPFLLFGNVNSDVTKSFLRLDLSLGYKLKLGKTAEFESGLAVQNILNRKNVNFRTNTFLETNNPSEFAILSRDINYLGRVPTIFISISF